MWLPITKVLTLSGHREMFIVYTVLILRPSIVLEELLLNISVSLPYTGGGDTIKFISIPADGTVTEIVA